MADFKNSFISPHSFKENKRFTLHSSLQKTLTKNSDIDIQQYYLADLKRQKINYNDVYKEFISIYQTIFRSPPWNEFLKCPIDECGQAYSYQNMQKIYLVKDKHVCVICKRGLLEDPHSEKNIYHRLKSELNKSHSFLLLSGKNLSTENIQKPEVVGFVWGFSQKFKQIINLLFENYLPMFSEQERKKISQKISKTLSNPKKLTYISDLGVLPKYRSGEVGLRLIISAAEKTLQDGGDDYLCWTSKGIRQTEKQKNLHLSTHDLVLVAGKFSILKDIINSLPFPNFMSLFRQNKELLRKYEQTQKNSSPMPFILEALGAEVINLNHVKSK